MTDLDFEELYKQSRTEPGQFWDRYAKDVIWTKPYSSPLEQKESSSSNWFVDGEINMCYNCLDRQVEEGYGEDVAVIFESPLTKTIKRITYRELLESVELLAGVMVQRCGLLKGDRVMFYMPMIIECFIGMLACTRIGAIHTVINSGFGYKEISMRIQHFEPKLIITSNVGVTSSGFVDFKTKVDSAIQLSEIPSIFCLVYNIPNHEKAKMNDVIDLDWDEEISKAKPQGPIPIDSSQPIFVNYTSGTTGDPKGLVIETAGAIVTYKYFMKFLFGLKPYETFFTMSSFSWILGGSVMTYGALMSRNPTIIYEGKPSDRNDVLEILRILDEHKIAFWICTPTTIRLMMKYCEHSDFAVAYDKLRGICLTGESYSLALKDWTEKTFKCPAYNMWGQTELGGPVISPLIGHYSSGQDAHKIKSQLLPGIEAKIVDRETAKELPNGTTGRLILKLPLYPARASTIFKNQKRFYEIYLKNYPGYYDTMDSAFILEDSIHIVAREDNIIQIASTRINGHAVEEACLLDRRLEEVAIVALEHPIKGYVPFGFFVLKIGNKSSEKEIIETAVKNILDSVGELACFDQAVIIPELPRSTGGKTLRISLELMINGKESRIPALVENPGVYSVIFDILRRAGYNPCLPKEL